MRIRKSSFLWKWPEGVQKIEHLYQDDNFTTFNMLKETFNLTDRGDFWKYLQIISSVGSVSGLNLLVLPLKALARASPSLGVCVCFFLFRKVCRGDGAAGVAISRSGISCL